ncbi:phosphoenolpyruvate carboxykinase (ATP) [Evansella sp. AB-rgal1]|uniref:phosphoenolpyruvate carboxykinase (ATP) n=1 Tax=Evansella sp. AB-rgal1 TaxID=3242696 RepID=UPI00359E4EDF
MSTVQFELELERLLQRSDKVFYDLPVAQLVERALVRKEGILTSSGAFQATTGQYTGRSPKDKFIVHERSIQKNIEWGKVNQPISSAHFERLYSKVLHYLSKKGELFVRHGYVGADKKNNVSLRIINELAWHNLFARQLFIRPSEEELSTFLPEFTIISAPGFSADPVHDGTNSEAFVIISFEKKTVLIGGTEYAGEMKKSIFSVMNYLLPDQNVLPMHCSANVGEEGDVALFFGLSGTGKTTLSADPYRNLIGDDEHGWSTTGVFNIEGGCYAKCINLSPEKEPQIYRALRFGSVLENVVVDEKTREANYGNTFYTENTRAAYPIESIPNAINPSISGHPSTIIFLTADAFGVLPPISKLTKEQAMYHFLSGYTSKLAGTERGVTKPEATFSTCFGAPFLPLPPYRYASMLGQKISEHNVDVFLVNTGWSGGPYGVGKRMDLAYTRAMVRAALQGELNTVETTRDPVFGLHIPAHCPGVPDELLQPMKTWKNKEDYKEKALLLAQKFQTNFEQFYSVSLAVKNSGPNI